MIDSELTFDRRQVIMELSIGLVLLLIGVLFIVEGPVFSARPFNSPIVTRAVGLFALIGGVNEIRLVWPIVSRWDQPPLEVDSSGMTLRAVTGPPKRVEWEEVAAIEPTKTGVAISLKDGETAKLHVDLILMDGRRPWAGQLADQLVRELKGDRHL